MIHVPEATAHELMNMGKENDDQVEYDLNGWIEKCDSKNEKKRKDEMTFQQIWILVDASRPLDLVHMQRVETGETESCLLSP